MYLWVTLLALLSIGTIILFIKGKGLHNEEKRTFKLNSSDAMLVDLNLVELAQTKSGVANKFIQYQSYSASYNKDWKIPDRVTYSLNAKKCQEKYNVRTHLN